MLTGEGRKIWPMISKKVLPIAMLGILCGGALSQNNQKTPDQNAFDRIGEQVANQQAAPGSAFLVWSHGSVVFTKGYGFADLASNTPVTSDTRFAIGSIGKQFTAAAILLLAQQNKPSLDDKPAKYLPQMPNADTITLRMLLNQDSGLHNYPLTTEHKWPLSGTIPPEKLIAILKTDKPDFAPGEKWEYSNTNYAVLAFIVSRVSGISYPDFLTSNIFTPLGSHPPAAASPRKRIPPRPTKEAQATSVPLNPASASTSSTEPAASVLPPTTSPAGTRHSSPASSSPPIRCTPSGPTAPSRMASQRITRWDLSRPSSARIAKSGTTAILQRPEATATTRCFPMTSSPLSFSPTHRRTPSAASPSRS